MGQPVEEILFVCTANICRSPMAEVLMRSHLGSKDSIVKVSSAGLIGEGAPADKKGIWALGRMGLDLTEHSSRLLSSALVETPDLIITMAREHLRSLASLDSHATSRTFTLKEFVFLSNIEGKRRPDETIADYVERVSAGRAATFLSSPGRELDIDDPIGRRKAAFAKCATEIEGLIESLTLSLYPMQEPAP